MAPEEKSTQTKWRRNQLIDKIQIGTEYYTLYGVLYVDRLGNSSEVGVYPLGFFYLIRFRFF
jgi:hypothetical protein